MVATQRFLFSSRKLGKWSNFDEYFSNGLVQPPTSWALFDPTRFAKEVKEKCGVKAKAGCPREKKLRVVGLGPQWPVLVWFEDQVRFWRLREVIASSTNLSKLPAICSIFVCWWVSDWMFPNLKNFGWLFQIVIGCVNKTTNLPGDPWIFFPNGQISSQPVRLVSSKWWGFLRIYHISP